MDRDLHHLRLLAIFHYVVAGLIACVGLFFVLYLVLGILLGAGVIEPDDPEASFAGFFIFGTGLFVMVLAFGFAAAVAWAGRCLSQQRSYVYCMVIAALLCTNAPLGTVLGVFTIVVLMRDSVRELFEGRAAKSG